MTTARISALVSLLIIACSSSWNDVNSFEHECGVDGYQLTMVERDGSWRVATASFQLIDCVDP